MEQQSLNVTLREEMGKGASRRIRRGGNIPGVLYGLGKNTPLTVNPALIRRLLLEEGGGNKILNIQGIGREGVHALVKDYQVDPVSRTLLHVDFLEIDVTKKVHVTVPLNFVGKSVGVAEGGVLNIAGRTLAIRCIPTQIPKHIDVDVTALAIGDSIHLDQVVLPEGVEKVATQNLTVVTVVPPAKEEELTAALAPTAEPEVITEKKAEGEEGEAGATPAAQEEKGKEKKEEKKK